MLFFLTLPVTLSLRIGNAEEALRLADSAQRAALLAQADAAKSLAARCVSESHAIEGYMTKVHEDIKKGTHAFSTGIDTLIDVAYVIKGDSPTLAAPLIALINAFKSLDEFNEKVEQAHNGFKEVKRTLVEELEAFQKEVTAKKTEIEQRRHGEQSGGDLQVLAGTSVGYTHGQ